MFERYEGYPPKGDPMNRKSTRINFSIHPDSKEDMDGIFSELKKRLLPVSGTICKLLKQFKADGYKFKDEVE